MLQKSVLKVNIRESIEGLVRSDKTSVVNKMELGMNNKIEKTPWKE